jgi:hypothetical protein
MNFGAGNQEKSVTLIYQLTRYTFFLMYIVSLPILLTIDSLLAFWLEIVPEFTKELVSLMIVHGLISSLESGFDASIESTGKIRNTKLWFNLIMLVTLPVTYILFSQGFPPYFSIVVLIVAEIIFLFVQLRILKNLLNFSILHYLSRSILPVLTVILFSLPQIYLRDAFGNSLMSILIFSLISVIMTGFTIYILGLKSIERKAILEKLITLKVRFVN